MFKVFDYIEVLHRHDRSDSFSFTQVAEDCNGIQHSWTSSLHTVLQVGLKCAI